MPEIRYRQPSAYSLRPPKFFRFRRPLVTSGSSVFRFRHPHEFPVILFFERLSAQKVNIVEIVSDMVEPKTAQFFLSLSGKAEYIQLQVEQFFEFESELCFSKQVGRLREMYILYGFGQINDLGTGDNLCR